MRYLITGGAGFIGSHLTDALIGRGASVLILDDLSTGRRANIEHIVDSSRVELVEASVLDEAVVDDCMASVDVCFHLASAVGVKLIVSKPLDTMRRNVRGTENVLSAAARHRKRLLFTSTSEIYGKNSDGALSEDSDRLLGPATKSRWAYSTAKAYGEALAYAYHREEGAEMIVVRLFNTVGPRQTGRYGMVLPRFVRQALQGADLTVYGNGTQSRCFAHVSDTVDALLLLVDNDDAVGSVFNVGSDEEVAIIELAARVLECVGAGPRVMLVPYEEAYEDGFEELGRRRPDTTALRELTGWRPARTLDDAIEDTVAYEQSTLGSRPALAA